MPKTDPDPLGDGFKWRLRAELNRVEPRYSSPRYLLPARHRIGAWRFAPAGLAAGVVSMLALTAYAATGTANPVEWTEKIVTTIETNPGPQATPSSEPGSSPSPHGAIAPPAAPTEHEQPGTPRPEPSEGPEPSSSPEPEGGGGQRNPSSPSPSSNPPPADH
jgi:hypothetical protein